MRRAIKSGKIQASSSANDIHDLIHTTPVLRSSKSPPSFLFDMEAHRLKNTNAANDDGYLFRPRKGNKSTKGSPSKTFHAPHYSHNPSQQLGSYRVANYTGDQNGTRSLASKMKKRRNMLRRERRQAELEAEPSLGSSRSFSSIWTIHSLLAASESGSGSGSGSLQHSTSSQHDSGITTKSIRSHLEQRGNIPGEFTRIERMLRLQKEMARSECRTIRAETFDEMDVSMMMLPADFLFEHKFEKYAKERSFDNVVRVMKRLVSNAKLQAWEIWWTFIRKERKREQFQRVNQFKKKKGEQLLSRIGARIMLGSLFKGFSVWKSTTDRMKNNENYESAVVIQRHWRGRIGRKRMSRRRKKIARVTTTILFIEWQRRRWMTRHAEEAAEFRKQHRACMVIANALRAVLARRELQVKRMEKANAAALQTMALRVQCAWRSRQGRFSLFLKQRAREAIEEERRYAASDIERIFRGHLGRNEYRLIIKKRHDDEKASRCLRRLLNRRIAAAFGTWSEVARRQAGVKRMLRRSLGGKLMHFFSVWSDNVADILNSLSEEDRARLARIKQEEEEAVRQQQEKEENDRKVKIAIRRMFNRLLTGSFMSWKSYTNQRLRARRLAKKILGNVMESRFLQWVEWVEELKENRSTMGRLAWEEEQRRLAEVAAREAAEERERVRKLKWAVAKMNQRLISACFLGLNEYAVQMLGVKKMLKNIMQGVKRRLYDRWWSVVLDRREQANTGNAFLRRLMNRKLYSAFSKWYESWRMAVRIRSKWAKKLVGKKRYFFELWYENGLKNQGQREINKLMAVQAERGRFVGLSKAMTSVLREIMSTGIEEMTYDDLIILRKARIIVSTFQEVEWKACLRVQTRWRTRKGQLAYQLIKQGKRMKQDHELRAVMLLSRVIRGRQGRRASVQMKELREKEKMKERYKRERRQEKEREKWLLETEENEFRETLIAKRKLELELEAAKMKSECARLEMEEQKFRNEHEAEEKRKRDLMLAKERSDHVAAFGGWVETKDIASDAPYYYNELTGASQWEKPPELGGRKLGQGDADSVAAWVELAHGNGQKYFYNTISGQSSWDDPRKKMSRAPKIERRLCMGKTKRCVNKKTGKNAVAIRECVRCREDYCMECFIEAHKSKKKNDHRFKPIVERKVITLNCRDCTSMASRWCKPCDVNFCDNCFAWAHQGGSLALHECQMFVPGSQICAECEKHVAIKLCNQCSDPFCGSCYDVQHRSGTKMRHTFSEIEVVKEILKDAEEYCSVCAVRAADRACDPCGDPFCSRCFAETHKSENKKGHSWTPWSRIRTGRDWVQINDEVSGQILYFNVKTRKTQTNKPTGLQSGLERDIEKKRKLAEKEMSARLDKERELVRLRQETTSLSREMKMTQHQLVEASKVQLPTKRSFFGEVIRSPSKIMKSRVLKYQIKEENTAKEKDFLRSRLVSKERDEEINSEAKQFGSERHADTVVDQLIGKLKTEHK